MKALFATAAVVASIAAAPTALGSNFITENSASQNGLHQQQSSPGFITENSASQNRLHQQQSSPGFITENSATQNRIQQPTLVTVAAPSGFDWGDAGIGAAGGVGTMLLLLGGGVVVARKRERSPLAA
jgi:hypothetical protein